MGGGLAHRGSTPGYSRTEANMLPGLTLLLRGFIHGFAISIPKSQPYKVFFLTLPRATTVKNIH